MATTVINSLTLTSVPTLPSVNANITGSVRLPQFKGLKIRPSLKTRSFGSLSQNPNSKLARGARVVCMAEETAVEGLGNVANAMTVETNGIIYNNTQDPITFVISHDWAGKIGIPRYPKSIAPGEGGTFKHEGTGDRSSAAIVYRGKNAEGIQCDFLLAWSNDFRSSNKAYTEIQLAAYPWNWKNIIAQLVNSPAASNSTFIGCVSNVILGDVFTATLTLKP